MEIFSPNKTEETNFHLSILQDVSQIISFSENFQESLDKVVSLVASKLNMDVCSIYLYDSEKKILILQASKGLNVQTPGSLYLKLGEGVTSMVIEELKPVSIYNAHEHPRFKYFPEIEERDIISFLGVPIIDSKNPIGVLVVQKKIKYHFHINEINMLQILAMQVSSLIQVARVLERTIQLENEAEIDNASISATEVQDQIEIEPRTSKLISLQGMATSFGYGYGKVLIFNERYNYSVITDKHVEDLDEEIKLFYEAISKSKEEINKIKITLREQISEDIIKIFDSHLMILDDSQLHAKIINLIKNGNNAAYATLQIIDQYIDTFSKFDDPYIREKIVDIEDIGRKIINNLLGIHHFDLSNLPEPCIVVSKFLTPSTTANLDTSKVVGIVTEHGGATSHASILARSLEIPAVVGVKNLLTKVGVQDHLIVDGNTGFVFLNPPKVLIHEYERKSKLEIQDYHNHFLQYTKEPLYTKDNIKINIGANIGIIMDIEAAKKNGAMSVGLFRTEFLYMTKDKLPTVDEQFSIYKEVIELFPNEEVIIRTLDLGGDKFLPYLPQLNEENPNLGYKSTRFLLDHPKILSDQLRAILKASLYGKIKLLFPMISSLSELILLKDFLEIAKGVLVFNNISFNDSIEVGMMIEVPSVIFQIEDFIPEVDFFSIGTNDLIQYLLAVDRDNEKVSNIYNPLHPAVLRAVHTIVTKVSKSNKRLAVCGEMAASAKTAFALLALGIYDLSANPSSIPYIHYLVKQVNKDILDEVRSNILSFSDVREVDLYLRNKLRDIAPKLHFIS
ncbi:MAG: phosphoenolpyruvate--protein phosphotransferase [Spirochaetota bacterium]|nr:phosphoenolpyruvate--protein phosphotransferase [Spirochaetota bacterium]